MSHLDDQAAPTGLSRRAMLTGALATAGAVAVPGLTAPARAAGAPARSRPSGSGGRTRLITLGTSGGPVWWPNSNRAGVCSALVVGDRYYIIDAGYGVGRQIRDAHLGNWESDLGGPLDALRAIFITHLHSDHVCDLNNLLTLGISQGFRALDQPVQVWGPADRGALPNLFGDAPAPPVVSPENPTPGIADMLDLMVRTFATDYNDRARDARAPVPSQLFSAHEVPIPDEYTDDPNGDPHPRMSPVHFYEDDRVSVSVTLVQHAPVFPAFAFRFDTEDGSVVFSGDTSPSENLIELASDADILVHEVMAREWPESLFPEPRDEVDRARLNHLLSAHTLIEDVGPVAEQAGARTLVLNHLLPGYLPVGRWRAARRGYSGHLVVPDDLQQLDVSAQRLARPRP